MIEKILIGFIIGVIVALIIISPIKMPQKNKKEEIRLICPNCRKHAIFMEKYESDPASIKIKLVCTECGKEF